MERSLRPHITIGRLAALSRLSTATLRYYEKLGLIRSVARARGGMRQFPNQVRYTLKAIERFKSMGFTLHEMLDLQQMPSDHGAHQQRFRRVLVNKLRAQEKVLLEAMRTKRALQRSLRACKGSSATCHCDLGLLLGGQSKSATKG